MSTPSSFKGTGGFDAANQKVTNLADALNPSDALNLRTFDAKNTVATYSTTRSYPIDFIVEYSGQLWKCNSATTSGAFDKTKWISIRGTENWIRITGAYTASAMDSLIVDTTSGAISITLPASPRSGDYVYITDSGNADISNITVIRNGSTIAGAASNLVLNESAVQVALVYLGGTWILNIERQNRIKFVSSSVTVESNQTYAMLISAGFNVTLPQAPKAGDWVVLFDRNGTAGTYPITINGGVKQVDGSATYTFNQKKAWTQFIYNGTAWVSFMLSGNSLLADKNLSDLADPVAARTSLGLGTAATQTMGTGATQIRTNAQNDLAYQQLDQTLTAIAALVTAADKLIYSTGVDTFAQTDFPAQARTFLAATTQALQRTALGLGTASTATVGTATGNVMPVGSFGLGGDMIVGDVDLNNYRLGGFYLTPITGLLNLPTGWESDRHSVIVAGSSTNYVSQIIIPVATPVGSAGKIAFRWSTSPGNWSAWTEFGATDGFGTAATRDVGTAVGNVMEVGAFGLGATDMVEPVMLDINTLLTTGMYYVAGTSTNNPIEEIGVVFVSGADASSVRATQTFRSMESNSIYERRLFNTWSNWVEVLHSDNTGTAATKDVGTSVGNVMAVGAGGWLAGPVSSVTIDLNTIATTQTLYCNPSSTNVPVAAYGQLFHLQFGDIQYAMQRYYISATGVEYTRYKAAGSWQPWTRVYTDATLYPTWTPVTYQNGWSDFDSTTYNGAEYRKEGNRVWFRGAATNATSDPAYLCMLPVGYRPIKAKIMSRGGTNFQIDSAGILSLSPYVSNTAFMLDGISYEID